MKKFIQLILVSLVIIVATQIIGCAKEEVNRNAAKRDVRAVWISTVFNLDWPSTKGDINAQKKEFIKILDDVSSLGFNTVIVQVRPKGDALYQSKMNPWSEVLTGIQGQDPGYDPLEFMIKEAHKRNLEIHAWLNPYRVTSLPAENDQLAPNNFAVQHPQWVIEYDNKLYYNPGIPEVRHYIVDTVKEIVENYDIDGIHFDDYFYPKKNIDDKIAYEQYGEGKSLEAFRIDSVNQLVAEVNQAIKQIKPEVKFGISPAGIWKNKSNDETGSDTEGYESYYEIFCDTRTWIQNEWIDYVVPQVYWTTDNKNSNYVTVVEWWNNEVKGKKTQLYIGEGIYKDEIVAELAEQIKVNEKYDNVKGSVYFTYSDISNNRNGVREALKELYRLPAIPYSMPWLNDKKPKPVEVAINDNGTSKAITIFNNYQDAKYYLIYRFNQGEKMDLTNPAKIIAKVRNNEGEYEEYVDNKDGDFYYAITALNRNHIESNPTVKLKN